MKYLILILLCAGCAGLVPSESQKSQSIKATENMATEQEKTIRRVLEVGPNKAMSVQDDGTVTSVPLREDTTITTRTTTGAGSISAAEGTSLVRIPLFVKVIGGCVAALFVMVIIWLARRSSAAVDAAWRVADRSMSSGIKAADAIIKSETNPEIMAKLNSLVGLLHEERTKALTEAP